MTDDPKPALKGTGFSPSGGSRGLQAPESDADQKGALAPEQRPAPGEPAAPLEPLRPEDFYMENGFLVFTAAYHLRRGYCCNSDCRHCPYK